MTFVYFISAGASPIKIGLSDAPLQRLADLQTAHYKKLHLLYTIECDSQDNTFKLEAAFHRWYGEHKLTNEWFDIQPSQIKEDIDLLTTFRQSITRIEQHMNIASLQGLIDNATYRKHRQQVNKRLLVQQHYALAPQDLKKPVRQIAQLLGVGHDLVNEIQRQILNSETSSD